MPVSVVIPNYNGSSLLRTHMPAVLRACSKQDEVIVVDDCSTDDSIDVLRTEFPSVKVVKNDKNVRFAASCNRGVELAKHEIVILLNSDVSPLQDTFRILEKSFSDDDIFAVGCLEKDKNGRISGRSSARFAQGLLQHSRASAQHSGVTCWASGGSMAVKKNLWSMLGGFSLEYKPAYYEDIDLSYQAWKRGWKVMFNENAVVLHEHESTNKNSFDKKKVAQMSYKNALLFVWLNITDSALLAQHLLWLPYHLFVTTLRTSGDFLIGYWMAVRQLFSVLVERNRRRKFWRLTDADIFKKVTV